MRFKGQITDGIGKHSELFVPGRNELATAPSDWPTKLQPGSLNVRVSQDGYPNGFAKYRHGLSVKNLDDGCLNPAFVIPQNQLGNNKLTPTPLVPRRGTAQVWRTVLYTDIQEIPCWVLRRIGSGLSCVLEIVAAVHLREVYNLQNGQCVELVLEASDA